MKRLTAFLLAALATTQAGMAQQTVLDEARKLLEVITAPKNLNSVRGIEREILRRELVGQKPGFLAALLEFYRARAYPDDTFDWEEYNRGGEYRATMEPAEPLVQVPFDLGPQSSPTGFWAFVGPRNTAPSMQQYFGDRAIMGRITALALPPNPRGTLARSKILYAATPGGGVWRTTDFGDTWEPLTDKSTNWPYLQVGALVVTNRDIKDPQTAEDIIIAGTGDPRGLYRLYSTGVIRSTDGGQTWQTPIGSAPFSPPVTSLVVDPDEPGRITLTTGGAPLPTDSGDNFEHPPIRMNYDGRIYQSTDYGATWRQILATNAYWGRVSIGAKRRDGTRTYWAVGWDDTHAYVKRSNDRGATWDDAAAPPGGIATGDRTTASIDVAASKNAPDTAYLMSGQDQRIWQTKNRGGAWTRISDNLVVDYDGAGSSNWEQVNYDYYLEAIPIPGGSADLVIAGLITTSAGRFNSTTNAWDWVDFARTGRANAKAHNDQHCVVFDRNDPKRFFIGHDGGLHQVEWDRTAAFDHNAFTMTNRSANLGITQFYEGAWHPTEPDRMLGGTQDNMSPRSSGAGGANLNNWVGAAFGDGSGSVISPISPDIQLTTGNGRTVFHTDDGWATSTSTAVTIVGRRSMFPPTVMDYAGLYYRGDGRIHRYTTDGTNLANRRQSNVAMAGNNYVTALAIAPADPSRLYAGASDGSLWMCLDTTANPMPFTRIDRRADGSALARGSPALRYVTDIVVDPFNPDRIVVTYSGIGTSAAPKTDHVYRCDDTQAPDASRSFVNVDTGADKLPNLPVNSVTWDYGPADAFAKGLDIRSEDIPDGNPAGLRRTITINENSFSQITNVSVVLIVTGSYNGDLQATLSHAGKTAILLNGVGRDGPPDPGYPEDGFSVLFTDQPGFHLVRGDIHLYQQVTGVLPPGSPVTGYWNTDGRDAPIDEVTFATPRTKRLDQFLNGPPNGAWELKIADLVPGDQHRLMRWGLLITGPSKDGGANRRVFVAGDAGVFRTDAIDANPVVWRNMTQPLGLPPVQVNDIEHIPGTGRLNIATFGRGMWRVDVGTAVIPSAMCRPTRFRGGGNRTTELRVNLARPAPAGGATVTVVSHDPKLTVPGGGNLVIPEGRVTGTMTLTSPGAVPAAPIDVRVEVRYGGETRYTQVRLTP